MSMLALGSGPELVEVLVDELLKVPARVWRETFAGLLEYDDMSDLARIRAPALLVWDDATGFTDELVAFVSRVWDRPG